MSYEQAKYTFLVNLITKGDNEGFIKYFDNLKKTISRAVLNEYSNGIHDSENSLLSLACMQHDTTGIINYLITIVRVDINHSDINGRTALYMAVDRGLVDNVRILIQNGADVDIADNHEGQTPLHVAAEGSNYAEELIELLCAAGAKYTINKSGATPLHTAAKHSLEAMQALMAHKKSEIDINAMDKSGETPLHHAAESETGSHATYLLTLGANRTIQNNDRKTAAQVANDWEAEGAVYKAIVGYKSVDSSLDLPISPSLTNDDIESAPSYDSYGQAPAGYAPAPSAFGPSYVSTAPAYTSQTYSSAGYAPAPSAFGPSYVSTAPAYTSQTYSSAGYAPAPSAFGPSYVSTAPAYTSQTYSSAGYAPAPSAFGPSYVSTAPAYTSQTYSSTGYAPAPSAFGPSYASTAPAYASQTYSSAGYAPAPSAFGPSYVSTAPAYASQTYSSTGYAHTYINDIEPAGENTDY